MRIIKLLILLIVCVSLLSWQETGYNFDSIIKAAIHQDTLIWADDTPVAAEDLATLKARLDTADYGPIDPEERKFRQEQKQYRSWMKPATILLLIGGVFFVWWAYKEMLKFNRGRLVIEPDPADDNQQYPDPERGFNKNTELLDWDDTDISNKQ